jgi:hypothetical protein
MEQAHWLNRKRASIGMAEKAISAEARLIHYELAGRYSVKAAHAARPQLHVEDTPPIAPFAKRKPPRSPDGQRS